MACAFCGKPGRTREHVFPRWIDRLLEPGARHLEHARYGAEGFDMERPSQTLDFVVARVCADCNNGWMSRLEEATQELLTGLIYGRWPGPLTAAHQTTLALWAVKTCLVLDLTQPAPVLDQSTRDAFRRTQTLPGGAHVWIALCADAAPPLTALTIRIELENLDVPGYESKRAFFSPIKLGHLVLLPTVLPSELTATPSPVQAPWVQRIAPQLSHRLLPPRRALASGPQFEAFANDFWRGWAVGTAPANGVSAPSLRPGTL